MLLLRARRELDHLALEHGAPGVYNVVDDEPALVEMSQDLLAELGYEAVGFTSASRALGGRSMALLPTTDTGLSRPVCPGERLSANVAV